VEEERGDPNGKGVRGYVAGDGSEDGTALEGGLMVILDPFERAEVTMSATVLRRLSFGVEQAKETRVGWTARSSSFE
jgi:hypothetical protein